MGESQDAVTFLQNVVDVMSRPGDGGDASAVGGMSGGGEEGKHGEDGEGDAVERAEGGEVSEAAGDGGAGEGGVDGEAGEEIEVSLDDMGRKLNSGNAEYEGAVLNYEQALPQCCRAHRI